MRFFPQWKKRFKRINGWGVGGNKKIVAKPDPSVSNFAWESIFQINVACILLPEDWVSWISPSVWQDTVSKCTHRLLKEGNNLERILYCACGGSYLRLSGGKSKLINKVPMMERLPRRFNIVEHQQLQLLYVKSPVPERGVSAIRPRPVFFFDCWDTLKLDWCTDTTLKLDWRTDTTQTQGRVCPSIEFDFISTIMGQDFSVPIKPKTRWVLKANSSSQIGALSLRINSRRVSNT